MDKTKKFSYHVFHNDSDILLAIADAYLIGKKLEDEKCELFVSPDFYSDKECNEKEAHSLIKRATIVNAIGKNIIAIMKKERHINEKNILFIQGVPHVQIITV